MGLPNINIVFRTAASSAVERSQRGIVGIILKDSATEGAKILTHEAKIPTTLSAVNQDYLRKTFLGYIYKPKKVIVYVLATDAVDLSDALAYFATQKINYLAGPPDCTADQAMAIKTWILDQRANKRTPKAVLPNTAADDEGIINFTTEDIKAGQVEYETAEYCGRIAGLIAGTPITISCTFAPLPEVTDMKRLSETEMNTAIDNGEFIIFHDGEKVKVGRGVNSLKTTTADKGDSFKKIKIIETVDMMKDDIRILAQDNYFGKYPNSYDDKCLLLTAIQEYFSGLENQGILAQGSTVEIDIQKTKDYLTKQEKDVSAMTDQEIKTANTGTHIFMKGSVSILDTIEDIDLDLSI